MAYITLVGYTVYNSFKNGTVSLVKYLFIESINSLSAQDSLLSLSGKHALIWTWGIWNLNKSQILL